MSTDRGASETMLAVFAHPDDAEFSAGGTVARWAREGRQIVYAVCTDGGKGGDAFEGSDEQLAALREREQRAAADVIGVAETVFLRHPDGELEGVRELKEELVQLIRQHRPSTVLTWDAWRPYQVHADHRAAGKAALDAVMAAANPRVLPDRDLPAHRVEEVWLFGTDNPDRWVDISDTFALKAESIRCHRSQVQQVVDLEERLETWNRALGEKVGYPLAEAFKVLRPHCDICR